MWQVGLDPHNRSDENHLRVAQLAVELPEFWTVVPVELVSYDEELYRQLLAKKHGAAKHAMKKRKADEVTPQRRGGRAKEAAGATRTSARAKAEAKVFATGDSVVVRWSDGKDYPAHIVETGELAVMVRFTKGEDKGREATVPVGKLRSGTGK